MLMTSAPLFRAAAAAAVALACTSCQTTPPPPDRFTQADRDGSGALDASEVTDYFVGAIFEERDTNKDGRITPAEWNPEMDAAEAREFATRDADKDGVVTRQEAVAHALAAGVYADDIRAADTNKDGLITREEARAYYASKE
jgi:Ca2+-binding EF-hand superfamily protein